MFNAFNLSAVYKYSNRKQEIFYYREYVGKYPVFSYFSGWDLTCINIYKKRPS